MFVLKPCLKISDLILGISEYHAELVAGSDGGTGTSSIAIRGSADRSQQVTA